jgi:DNA primase catalytic subunit
MKNTAQPTPLPSNPNLLKEIHAKLITVPISFRARVCEDCDWGIPTFYRTMRREDELSKEKDDKVIPAISNANSDKIIDILSEVANDLQEFCEKLADSRNNGKTTK